MWGRHLISTVALLAVAGCSTGHGATAARAAAPATSATRPQPTTTTAAADSRPLYSFDNSVPPPPLLNTGTDYPRIINSLLAYSDWLYAHRPDVTLVSEVSAGGSQSERAHLHDLPQLAGQNHRAYELRSSPDELEIINVTPHAVAAKSIQHLTAQVLVDVDGRTLDRRVRKGATTYRVLIERSQDGRWRLVALDEVSG